jgi:uncharacterized protein
MTEGTGDPNGAQPQRIVVAFAQRLRANGLAVPIGSVVTFASALGLVGLDDPDRVYWAGRATLVCRPEDVGTYNRVFTSFWADVTTFAGSEGRERPLTLAVDAEDVDAEFEEGPGGGDVLTVRWSPAEVLSTRDLGSLTADEWAEAKALISALRVGAQLRRSLRTRPTRRRSGGPPDLRGTFRRNVRYGGIPLNRAWREPVERPRRMVFLLDVSGSMEPYSRALVRFAHAAVASRRSGRVEVFTMGTRLTRVTREMGRRDPEAALTAAAAAVHDWSGGTRLGSGLAEFNETWGVRGTARGAVVVICSDGWDRGDPDVMAAQMARLSLVAHRVIWVNPLKASPGYAPLARGMAAALPYVDLFVEGHSVSSLEELAARIAGGRPKEVTA